MKKGVFLFIILFNSVCGFSQQEYIDSILFNSQLFEENELLHIYITADFKKLNKEKSDEKYIPGSIAFYAKDSSRIEKKIRIKARGEFRRRECSLVPFWLNFKKADLKDDYFKGVNKIKVVAQCHDADFYKNCLLKEYIAYKLYNIISENSFKVRLLNITYIDEGRDLEEVNEFAFVIEPEEILAKRIKAYPLKLNNVRNRNTDSVLTTVVNLFQYMIGNTDFSVPGRHNVKLLTWEDYTKPGIFPVPYDFDFSGLVKADYASPHPTFDIERVTQRYYYGVCQSDQIYLETIKLFLEKKEEIFETINTFEYFDKRTLRYVNKYIQEFYDELEEPDFIKKHIRSTCTKINKE